MENYEPRLPLREPAPDVEPSKKKPRRNKFELFKKREQGESKVEDTEPEKHTEKTAEPEGRRRIGAKVLGLLRGKKQTEQAPEPEAVELQPTAAASAEVLPAPPTIVERAKEMGRGVLRLLGKARIEVQAADDQEQVIAPTDLTPLTEADRDVRAAMQELIAPIGVYEVEHILPDTPEGAEEQAEQAAPEESLEPIAETSTSGLESVPSDGGEPGSRPTEMIAAVASTAAEMLATRERRALRVGRVRRLGLLAIGATTAGALVYTWRRQRQLKKEQRELRKELKQFETEVRAHQAAEEQRLHQLQETSVNRLTQPQRQQYVQEVSEFAHERADEIRTVAQHEHGQRLEQSTPRTTDHSIEVYRTPAAKRQSEAHKAPTAEQAAVVPPRPEAPSQTKERGFIERLATIVTGSKSQTTGAAGGNVLAAGTRLAGSVARAFSAVTNSQPKSPTSTPMVKPQPQAWLFVAALGVGVVVVILMLAGIL